MIILVSIKRRNRLYGIDSKGAWKEFFFGQIKRRGFKFGEGKGTYAKKKIMVVFPS